MATFLNRVLEWVDDLYDFRGSKVRADSVDMGPVNLTQEVGRTVVTQRALTLSNKAIGGASVDLRKGMGRILIREETTTVAPGTPIIFAASPWGLMDTAGIPRDSVDLFLVDCWGGLKTGSNAADFVSLTMGIDRQTSFASGSVRTNQVPVPIREYDKCDGLQLNGVGAQILSETMAPRQRLPARVYRSPVDPTVDILAANLLGQTNNITAVLYYELIVVPAGTWKLDH